MEQHNMSVDRTMNQNIPRMQTQDNPFSSRAPSSNYNRNSNYQPNNSQYNEQNMNRSNVSQNNVSQNSIRQSNGGNINQSGLRQSVPKAPVNSMNEPVPGLPDVSIGEYGGGNYCLI